MILIVLFIGLLTAQTSGNPRATPEEQRANAHYKTGWELIAHESWAEAAREFQAAIDVKPDFKFAHYGLGRANMGEKKFSDAIRAYEKCRELYESEASRKFSNKSDADRMMSDDVMQIDMVLQRLRAGPQTPQTQVQIIQWENTKQRMQNRLKGTDTMSMTSPVPAFVSLALGSAFLRSNRFADAEREYKAALVADPKSGETYSNLAVVYLLTERYDEADAAVKAAEKTGFKVNPGLKEDIRKRKR